MFARSPTVGRSVLHADADQESSVLRPRHPLADRGHQTAAYRLRPSQIPVEPASAPPVIARLPLPDVSWGPVYPQQTPTVAWPTPIQCCGIGTSCDCPPHEKLAGTQHDLQTAAVPPDLALLAPLAVGRADDPAEHEADRIAARVSRMPDPQGFVTTSPPRPRRTSIPHSGNAGVRVPDLVHEVLGSPGRPLDAASRGFMEHRFSRDFSRVRVHDDTRAALSARALNAHAYTLGYDVVFGTGKYSPNSADGRRLLAHELVHVVFPRGRSFRVVPVMRRG